MRDSVTVNPEKPCDRRAQEMHTPTATLQIIFKYVHFYPRELKPAEKEPDGAIRDGVMMNFTGRVIACMASVRGSLADIIDHFFSTLSSSERGSYVLFLFFFFL